MNEQEARQALLGTLKVRVQRKVGKIQPLSDEQLRMVKERALARIRYTRDLIINMRVLLLGDRRERLTDTDLIQSMEQWIEMLADVKDDFRRLEGEERLKAANYLYTFDDFDWSVKAV